MRQNAQLMCSLDSASSLTVEVEAVIHALCWIVSRGDSQTAKCHHPHKFKDPTIKSEKWNKLS